MRQREAVHAGILVEARTMPRRRWIIAVLTASIVGGALQWL
jgi:hypothetical protein